MHVFLAASSRANDYISRIAGQFGELVARTVPFQAHQTSVAKGERTFLASYEAKNPLFKTGSFAEDKRGAFAFAGVPLIDFGRRYDAGDIRDYFRKRGATGFRQTVGGTYSAVSTDGDRLTCFTDLCSRFPVFYRETSGGVLVSNLPRHLAAFDEPSEWELSGRAATALVVHSQIWGNHTLFPGVKLLDPRHGISAEAGELTKFGIDDDCWKDFGSDYCLGPKQYQKAADAMRGSFRALGHLIGDQKITLGLSGGKDSRVMAAYVVAGGLRDKVGFFTGGITGSPEFGVARRVAKALGTTTDIRASAMLQQTGGDTLKALRYQLGRYDGMLLPVAGKKQTHTRSPNVEITGFGGELYRRGISKQFVSKPLTGWHDAAARWKSYHVPPDALGVVRDCVKAADAAWMADWVEGCRQDGIPMSALPELFFASYRVPLHQGLAAVASGAVLSVDPLVNPVVQRTHNRFGAFAGAGEMTHASLLWHVNPELLAIPFLKDRWSPLITPKFLNFELASEPVAGGMSDRSIRPIAWDFFKNDGGYISDLTDSQKGKAFFDLVDFGKWSEWLASDREIKSTVQVNQAYTLVGLMMRASGDYKMPVDGPLS